MENEVYSKGEVETVHGCNVMLDKARCVQKDAVRH